MLYNDIEGSSQSDEAKKWNELVTLWEQTQVKYDLEGRDVEDAIEKIEAIWYDTDSDHEQSIVRWNNYVTGVKRVREAAETALKAKKVDLPDKSSMDWDDHVKELEELGEGSFVTVTVTLNTDLGGGHGKGTYWKAKGLASGAEYSGTVADNTHGLSDSALKGASSTVISVFDLHNHEVDLALGSIAWPSV
jgi:hypothetical protein